MRHAAVTVVLSCAALAAGVTATGAASGASVTRVCGQLTSTAKRQLPSAKYLSLVSGIRSSGSTWTVLATGVPCGTALSSTPALLRQWQQARLGARLDPGLAGYTCVKAIDRAWSGSGQSSGGFVCQKGSGLPASVFAPGTFAARETSPYTIAQIKAFFHIQ